MAKDDNDKKTVIKIEGDSDGAQIAIRRVANLLKGLAAWLNTVRTAIGKLTRAMGVFYLAAGGFRLVVNAFKSLREWLNRAAVAAKALREALAKVRYANEVAAAAEAYKKLNAEIERANRLEQDRNNILKNRRVVERDNEDARRELSKQGEIAALDPAADDYRERRMAIERKYERMASDTAESRAREDSAAQAAELRGQAAGKERAIAGQEKALDRQRRITATAAERWRVSGSEEDLKEFQDQVAKEDLIRDAIKNLNDEADSLRRQAAELVGGNLAAKMLNAANQQRITNEEREDAARKDQEAKREAERAAEAARREAERQAEADRRTKEREIVEQIRATDDVASGIVSVAPSQSRLNAMGLGAGSGVQRVQQEMANSLKDLVRLGRDQLAALKDIQNEDGGATFQ